jgi:hypothetical protein
MRKEPARLKYTDADIDVQAVDVPVTVCLEHGRFVPCRSKEEHRYSSEPRDVELVRYHQQVSARLQRKPEPPPPPVYREVAIQALDLPLRLDEAYGDQELLCAAMTLAPARLNYPEYLVTCDHFFRERTVRGLLEEIRQHISAMQHYEQVAGD